MTAKELFTEDQKTQIVTAITEAERQTSGEIRVHLDKRCKGNPVEQAMRVFTKLGMRKTALRNGVLIYLAVEDKKMAIIGDQGIYDLVTAEFWEEIKERMMQQFKKGLFTEGLIEAIAAAGVQLKTYFPYQKSDVNELSDDISFGN